MIRGTALLLVLGCVQPSLGQGVNWRDPSRTADERARGLLALLTVEEKVALVHADGTFTSAGVPRLGVGKLWMSDGPQGVREEIQASGWNAAGKQDDLATALPAGICLAASFDGALAQRFGGVIGEEARARGKHIMLCPAMNIMRTPLCGRNSEYFGEDPYLAGRMAAGVVRGVQGKGVAACAKHFALNNQEWERGQVDVHVDERTMREIYLPAFKAAVVEGGVWTVMSAYNRVNGVYCGENEFLLGKVLKGDWGFQGLVMTDWGGCHSTVASAMAGLDLEMGSNVQGDHNKDHLAAPLLAAIHSGQVPMARLDEMALRNLRVMATTGVLDEKPAVSPYPDLMAAEHVDVAREVSEGGTVLLKNAAGFLPLDHTKLRTIAVIGHNAVTRFAHDGNSAAIKTAYEVTPLEGITRRVERYGVQVKFAEGYAGPVRRGRRGTTTSAPTGPSAAELREEAVAAAKGADVAIVVAGLYRAQDQEGEDRPNMELPPGQGELIAAITQANPRTVVVLTGGSPSEIGGWLPGAGAVLMYWYGGTEGGNALARIVFGDVSPSGHLPCSWPKVLKDSPAHHGGSPFAYPGGYQNAMDSGRGEKPKYPTEVYGEGIYVGYRWYDSRVIEPEFPFGFGLTYSTFALSEFQVAGPGSAMSVTLRNTGVREAAEVVQVYVTQDVPDPAFPRPARELKAIVKAKLAAGASRVIKLALRPEDFAHYDSAQHAWVAEAGTYTVSAGTSSRDLPVRGSVKLEKAVVIPEGGR